VQISPLSEKQIKDNAIWRDDEYPFDVVTAEEKLASSTGRPMIELKLRVSNDAGGTKIIYDRLLKETPLKTRHAAEACGMLSKYEAGSITDTDFDGKHGWLKLGKQKAQKGYPARNVVVDYIVATKHESSLDEVLARAGKR
jgi:hypothetical protein